MINEFIKTHAVKGAIFDMDGTLTSSMTRWGEIYAQLSDILNIELPREFLMKYNHFAMKDCAQLIIKDFSLNVDAQSVYATWLSQAVKYYENVFKVKPYMLETLKKLKALGIKSAVATASDGECARAFIKSNALEEYFLSITSLDEVARPKSFPDVYIKAAEKLGISPAECIVFEDALTAIKGAKSGGFYICGVQDDCSGSDAEEIKRISDVTLGF